MAIQAYLWLFAAVVPARAESREQARLAIRVCERGAAAFERIVAADACACAPGGRLATAVDTPSLRRGAAWHCRRRTLASRCNSWSRALGE